MVLQLLCVSLLLLRSKSLHHEQLYAVHVLLLGLYCSCSFLSCLRASLRRARVHRHDLAHNLLGVGFLLALGTCNDVLEVLQLGCDRRLQV